jgi:uncharacterized membrane protein
MGAVTDPIRARRAQADRLASLGRRLGYLAFAAAIVLFVAGFVSRFSTGLTTAITACLIVGSVLLAPAIIVGYAVKAAEREDRERGL